MIALIYVFCALIQASESFKLARVNLYGIFRVQNPPPKFAATGNMPTEPPLAACARVSQVAGAHLLVAMATRYSGTTNDVAVCQSSLARRRVTVVAPARTAIDDATQDASVSGPRDRLSTTEATWRATL